MKFNKELIEKLQRGEIALEYDGKSLDELKAILKEAFPCDDSPILGRCKYYLTINKANWWPNATTNLPTKPIKDFILQEFPEKWAIKLYPEVREWVNDNTNNGYKYDSKDAYFHFPNYYDFNSFKGGWHTAAYVKENYTLITLEKFKEHILKEKTMYKYTPQYVKNNKIAIHVKSIDEIGKIKILLNPQNSENYNYYFNDRENWYIHFKNNWLNINSIHWNPIKNYEIIEAEDFIKNNTKECNMENKKIVGYLAPYDLFNGNIKKGETLVDFGQTGYGTNNKIHRLPKEIVEQWEPVYEEEIKIDDVLYIKNKIEPNSKSGDLIKVIDLTLNNRYQYWVNYKNIKTGHTGGFGYSYYISNFRKATPEEIKLAQEKSFNMGSFTVKVKDGKAYHNSEDITQFVKDLVLYYAEYNKFRGYDAIIDEVTFKKTGCQNNTTKLSDWKKVYDALNQ